MAHAYLVPGSKGLRREDYYYAVKDTLHSQHSITEYPLDGRYHFHDNFEIYLYLAGNADFFIEESHYHLQRGHLLVLNDKEIHRVLARGTAPYERATVHFDQRLVSMLNTPETNLLACFRDRAPGVGNVLVCSEDELRELLAIMEELERMSGDAAYGSDILLVVNLARLLVRVNQLFNKTRHDTPSSMSGVIAEIIQYIGTNVTRKLTLESIAEQFLLDKFYLSHLFHEETGDTLYQYILIKKIAYAKRLLGEGKSVADTCELAGFNDYNNFIRTFKKITGTTPGKYLS